MALLTMIARVIDGLPLVGTMQDDEQVCFPSILAAKHFNFLLHFKDWPQYYGVSESSKNVIP